MVRWTLLLCPLMKALGCMFLMQRLCRHCEATLALLEVKITTPKIITPSHHHTTISKGPAHGQGDKWEEGRGCKEGI